MSGSAKRLRAGRVVQIRLNPNDCMAIVDIVKQSGMYTPGMSFAQATIIAFACMAQSFRKSDLIPTRDGFEYNKMMAEFPPDTKGRGALQYKLNKDMRLRGAEYVYPAAEVEVPPGNTEEPTQEEIRMSFPDPLKHSDPHVRALAIRIQELDFKRSAAPDSWDTQDQEEYDKLQKEIIPFV